MYDRTTGLQLTTAMIHICMNNFLVLLSGETIKELEETIPSFDVNKNLITLYFVHIFVIDVKGTLFILTSNGSKLKTLKLESLYI